MFGRLLHLLTIKDLDLKRVLAYPLSPVPLTFAHIDGTKTSTDKSPLFSKLEARVHTDAPRNVDVCIVDGMFVIQSLVDLPTTFGGVANVFLSRLVRQANRVDFVCDTYKHPSIKDITREDRGSVEGEVKVSGPEQRRPKDFTQALKSESFKISLFRFLANEWCRNEYATVLNTSELYFGLDEVCYRYKVVDGQVIRQNILDLNCQHEEADTRIVLHIKHACEEIVLPNIVVRCIDTDVLIILLYHTENIEGFVWMDVGLDRNNTRRFVDVTKLSGELGRAMCSALPALHAFTGCDYTSAFLRKGKSRPVYVAEKSARFMNALKELGTSADIPNSVEDDMEAFVCSMYGKSQLCKVDDARYAFFRDRYAPKDENHPLIKIKGADASVLPPSKTALHQKILQTNLVAYMWKNAHRSVLLEMSPTECGSVLKNDRYTMNWYACDQMPDEVGAAVDESADDLDPDEDFYSSASDDSDYEENVN